MKVQNGVGSCIRGGDMVNCPVCDAVLIRHDMGIHAHLRSHVRKKEVTHERAFEIRRALVGLRAETVSK